jgi:outer membrane murein-binding lipoprotein Lpp
MKNLFTFIIAGTTAIILSGCANEPSEQEINKAVAVSVKEHNESVDKLNASMVNLQQTMINSFPSEKEAKDSSAAKNTNATNALMEITTKTTQAAKYELVNTTKLGKCEAKDKSSFECSVKLTLKNINGVEAQTTKVMLTKAENGSWVVLDE